LESLLNLKPLNDVRAFSEQKIKGRKAGLL